MLIETEEQKKVVCRALLVAKDLYRAAKYALDVPPFRLPADAIESINIEVSRRLRRGEELSEELTQVALLFTPDPAVRKGYR